MPARPSAASMAFRTSTISASRGVAPRNVCWGGDSSNATPSLPATADFRTRYSLEMPIRVQLRPNVARQQAKAAVAGKAGCLAIRCRCLVCIASRNWAGLLCLHVVDSCRRARGKQCIPSFDRRSFAGCHLLERRVFDIAAAGSHRRVSSRRGCTPSFRCPSIVKSWETTRTLSLSR